MSDDESRGFLTETDKKWLRGEVEYEHRQTAAKRRAKVRERVARAMEDFQVLMQYWSAEERAKLDDETDIHSAAETMIEFLYVLLNENAQDAQSLLEEDGDPTDDLLVFREALTAGIKRGKRHFGQAPNLVTIDANTRLFEFPSDREFRSQLDTDQWRDANEYARGASNRDDDTVIDKDEAVTKFKHTLIAKIENELVARRQRADSEINRHEHELGSTGLLSDFD